MKAVKGSIGHSVDQPDPKVRFYLFHGPDEAQSSALGDRLVTALKAAKHSVPSGSLRGDPALLADEAGAIDMFGGAKVIWIQPAGEEIVAAVEALMDAPAAKAPSSRSQGGSGRRPGLLKLADSHALALSHISYELDARDAERLVADLARTEGLRPQSGVAVADRRGLRERPSDDSSGAGEAGALSRRVA